MVRSFLPSIVVGCVLFGASTAAAQDTTKVAAAESLFQEAEKLEAAGNFQVACGKYAESQQLDPGLGTLLHLAQCYEKAGKTASAWGRYREAMELAVRAGDQRSEIARKRAENLEPKLAKLIIAVKPEHQVPGLSIARDGVAVGAPQWNLAIPVDPGEHVVIASAEGYLPTQTKVVTPAHAVQQTVQIPKLALDPKGKPGEETPGRGNTQRIVGLTLASTGAAALIVGGIFGVTAKSAYDKSDPHCDDRDVCSPTGIDARNDGFTQATTSTILVAAGLGLVGAGAVVFFTAPHSRSKSGARTTTTPRIGFGPAGFSVRGSF